MQSTRSAIGRFRAAIEKGLRWAFVFLFAAVGYLAGFAVRTGNVARSALIEGYVRGRKKNV